VSIVLYVTTSRKPSPATRRLARALATFFGGEVENRGKRSIPETVERASAKGYSRVALVYESHGNPCEIALLEPENWLGRILLTSVSYPAENSSRVPQGSKPSGEALDEAGSKVLELFGVTVKRGVTAVVAGEKQISFRVGPNAWGPLLRYSSIEAGPEELPQAAQGLDGEPDSSEEDGGEDG
jgi:hypothetical protein